MQIIEVEQGTEEWFDAKCGLPSASMFSSIITPPSYVVYYDCGNAECRHRSEGPALKCKKGKGKAELSRELSMGPSKSRDGYMNKLLAEWKRGIRDDSFYNDWMKRGHQQEEWAARAYAMLNDSEIEQVGICLSDDGRYGASPDRLVVEEGYYVGGLEVKSPSPGVHVGYMRSPNEVPSEYRPQVLGSLLVTGLPWWDFISYHPDFEPVIVRTRADDIRDQLKELSDALDQFCKEMEYWKEQLFGEQSQVVVFDNLVEPSAEGIFG